MKQLYIRFKAGQSIIIPVEHWDIDSHRVLIAVINFESSRRFPLDNIEEFRDVKPGETI